MRVRFRCLTTYVATFALLIVPVHAQTQQKQTPTPGSIEPPAQLHKYKEDKLGTKSEQVPEDAHKERMDRICAKIGRTEKMIQLRKTGKTDWTKEQIEDFLDEEGIKKGKRFDAIPVCDTPTLTTACGVKDEWMVRLQPEIPTADVEKTIDALMLEYNMKRHPKLTIADADLYTGAWFMCVGAEIQAEKLSQDPRVRLVEQERKALMVPASSKTHTEPTTKTPSTS